MEEISKKKKNYCLLNKWWMAVIFAASLMAFGASADYFVERYRIEAEKKVQKDFYGARERLMDDFYVQGYNQGYCEALSDFKVIKKTECEKHKITTEKEKNQE